MNKNYGQETIDDMFMFRSEKDFLGERDLKMAYRKGVPVILWVKDGDAKKTKKLQMDIKKYDVDGWIQMWQNPNVKNIDDFREWYLRHIASIANEKWSIPNGHDCRKYTRNDKYIQKGCRINGDTRTMKPERIEIPDSDCTILTKDGHLMAKKWVYDDEKEEGEFKTKRVDYWSPGHFHDEPCYFETGVTLKSLFTYLNTELDLWDGFCGNWLKDIVKEGLENEFNPNLEYGKVEYLELYWMLEKTIYTDKSLGVHCSGLSRMDFHGQGVDDKDEDTSWAIEFSPIWELIGLPLVVNPNVILWIEDHNKKGEPYEQIDLGVHHPSLFQIVYGVIWELSFCGSPADRDEKKSKIDDIMDEVDEDLKTGRYKTIEVSDD